MQIHGKSVRNIYRYHEEILYAMKKYVQQYGTELESIGVDSWGGDFVLLDRNGDILKLPASYRATSAGNDIAEIVEQKIGRKELYMQTGNQAMPTDTLSQLIRLKYAGDPSMDDPRGILFMGDIYHYLLGAPACCEHSLAGYGRIYDNREGREGWNTEVMKRFGIPVTIQTPVVYAGDVIGQVDPVILKETGLKKPVKIITPCTHDTSCAALAIPDHGKDWIFISSGTWSLLGTETEKPVINEKSFASNFSNSSMPLGTNMFKKNIQGMWMIQQCRKKWGEKYSYSDIVAAAEKVTDNNVYIDVDMEEFYSPEDMPLAITKAIKRDFQMDIDSNDVGKIARICFESLALKYRWYCDRLLEAADKKITKIYIVGGGSNNTLVNQFTANVTGYPVYTGVTEGSNVGNILLQAYGSGELAGKTEMREVICNTFLRKKYSPESTDKWEKKYQVFSKNISHKAQW